MDIPSVASIPHFKRMWKSELRRMLLQAVRTYLLTKDWEQPVLARDGIPLTTEEDFASDVKYTEEVVDAVCKILRKQGWKTCTGYGKRFLFVYLDHDRFQLDPELIDPTE